MDSYVIRGGSVILASGMEKADLLIEEGRIAAIGEGITADGAKEISAAGCIIAPGLVDLHCHLREPGFEYKEDIASGTRAAAAGGFTSVCCMANTDPVNDNAVVTEFIKNKAQRVSPVHVYPIAAVTKGLKGEELTEVGELMESGAVALSDDGKSVKSALRMRLALSYAKRFGAIIVTHPEDADLVDGGVMNEGYWSTALGLPGTTRAAEETIMARDIMLAELEDAPLHIAHVSTSFGAELVRAAKKRGARVTAETAPHYLYATDSWVEGYDAVTRVNPPLRTEQDRLALIEALVDGTIDCIATDHAPHHRDEKEVEYALAAPGISGFETALAICWTALVASGVLSPERLFELMSSAPAKLFGLPAGVIEVGGTADVVVFDPEKQWVVDPKKFLSKGKNTPFGGRELTGFVRYTFAGGVLAFEEGTNCSK